MRLRDPDYRSLFDLSENKETRKETSKAKNKAIELGDNKNDNRTFLVPAP